MRYSGIGGSSVALACLRFKGFVVMDSAKRTKVERMVNEEGRGRFGVGNANRNSTGFRCSSHVIYNIHPVHKDALACEESLNIHGSSSPNDSSFLSDFFTFFFDVPTGFAFALPSS